MELEFGKQFKDATNLLLIMDYDSGYVEAGESSSCTSLSKESVSSTKMSVANVSQNFLFNEDALLEKPEISLNWSTNLPYEIDLEEYEESRQLFFSPDYINASVQSDNSTLAYSGFQSESSSDESTELPVQKPILVTNNDNIPENEITDEDVLIISASEIDMSFVDSEEESKKYFTLESQNRGYNNLITDNSAIKTLSPTSRTNFKCANEDSSPQNTEDEVSLMECDNVSLIESDDSSMETEEDNTCNSSKQATPEGGGSVSVESSGLWSVKNTTKKLSPSKSNPLDTVTNTFDVPKEKRRLTLVFRKSEKENSYSVKRKYPSLTPTKRTPENAHSSEQAYPCMTPEKKTPTLADPYVSPKKSSRKNVDSFKLNLHSPTPEKECSSLTPDSKAEHTHTMYPSRTPKKNILEQADPYVCSRENVYSTEQNWHSVTPEKACSIVTLDKKASEPVYHCMTPEKKTPTLPGPYLCPTEKVNSFENKLSSMTPEKKIPKLADKYISPEENVMKNINFKQKLPHMIPEKKIQKFATSNNNLSEYNAHIVETSKVPEKSTSKLADQNVSPNEDVWKNSNFKQKLPNMTPEKKIQKIAGPNSNLKEYNVEISKPPEKIPPKLVDVPCVSPRENVKRNVFKKKLFNMTPEKKMLQPGMISEKLTPNLADPYVGPKQNFKRKFPNMTPEKTIQKLAVNNSMKKYNGNSVKDSRTPEKQPSKPVDSYFSPDLFDDDDMVDESTSSYFEFQSQQNNLSLSTKLPTEEKYATKLDQKLLKRTQKGMSGVLPPPSVTIVQLSAQDILSKWEENKIYCFWTKSENSDLEKQDKSFNSSTSSNSYSKSLLLSVGVEEAKHAEWPEIYDMRCHGLHHNCGKVSEEIVDLCDKYQKRFVGAETQSTCTIFEKQNLSSPSKRKITKPRFGGKSPGRRLSHLARRRITFSHANLQASSSSLAGSRARQILVDAKKIELVSRRKSPRKTPKKTPRKTPSKNSKVKARTPSSSAKKKLAMRFRKLTGEFEKSVPTTSEMSSTQRALFNSPIRGTSQSVNRSTKRALFQSPGSNSNSSIFSNKSQDLCGSQEKSQFRRALFISPKKHSPMKMKKSPFKQFGMERKRKRSESDDLTGAKFARSMSMDHRPSTSSSDSNKSLSRTQSDMNISLNRSQSQMELSDQHKRKLLWAVSGALKSQNVTSTHPQWKVFASVLARVTRKFYINQIQSKTGRLEYATSERMHRIARHHVISVIKGKTADEVYNDYMAKNRALKVQRPQGYVAPEEFLQSRPTAPSGGKENAFQDRSNTMESWEKKKVEQMSKPSGNKLDRIRKVINFGDDR